MSEDPRQYRQGPIMPKPRPRELIAADLESDAKNAHLKAVVLTVAGIAIGLATGLHALSKGEISPLTYGGGAIMIASEATAAYHYYLSKSLVQKAQSIRDSQ